MSINKSLALVLLTAGASSFEIAQAQGATCATATPINTTGQWSWFASGFTAQTPFSPGTDCEFRPGYIDYFFEWTAPNSGHYQVDTMASTWDTQLAVYSGPGCAGTCVAYDYQTGSIGTNSFFASSIILLRDVTAGDVFLIRVGSFPDAHTPTDRLTITEYTDPCIDGIDDALEENNRQYSAIPLADGTHANLWASHVDPDFYSFCVAAGATVSVDVLFNDANGNLNAALFDTNLFYPDRPGLQLTSSNSNTDNELLTWTNTGSTNAKVSLRVNIHTFTQGSDCNDYDLVVSGSGNCQFSTTTFCDPMDVNSTGLPTKISASSSATATTGVRLEASQGPPGQFAYFLGGNAFAEPGISLGEGRFCIGLGAFQRFGRYNVWNSPLNSLGRFQPDGTLNNIVGTSGNGKGYDVPAELPFDWFFGEANYVIPGQTWHFQLWHREANGSSNLSNGLSVTF